MILFERLLQFPVACALLGCGFMWFVTALGAGGIFIVETNGEDRVGKTIVGFAAGVMCAASFWSLLDPAVEQAKAQGGAMWILPMIGFASGCGTIAVLSDIAETLSEKRNATSRDLLTVIAVTLHNFPEGLVAGVAFGAAGLSENTDLMHAWMLTLGIALQDFPEGFAVAAPLRRDGLSAGKSFFWGQLSGAVEPIGGLLGVYLVSVFQAAMPFLLSFAAGAMLFVVFGQLIPEAVSGKNERFGLLGCEVGFCLMMIADVAF
jgi:ZIP family zinc transporter